MTHYQYDTPLLVALTSQRLLAKLMPRKPASAASLRANASDAKRLLVTQPSFLDCQLIGAAQSFSPRRNTINAPCEEPSGKLAYVASE